MSNLSCPPGSSSRDTWWFLPGLLLVSDGIALCSRNNEPSLGGGYCSLHSGGEGNASGALAWQDCGPGADWVGSLGIGGGTGLTFKLLSGKTNIPIPSVSPPL